MHTADRLRPFLATSAAAAAVVAGHLALGGVAHAQAGDGSVDLVLAVETGGQTTDATTPAPAPDATPTTATSDPQPASVTEPTGSDTTAPAPDTTTTTTIAPAPAAPEPVPSASASQPAPATDGGEGASGPEVGSVVVRGETASRDGARAAGNTGAVPGPPPAILTWPMKPIAAPGALPRVLAEASRPGRERSGGPPVPHVAGPGQVDPVAVAGRVGPRATPVPTIWSHIEHAAGTYGPWLALYGIALVVRTVASSAVRDQRNPAPVRVRGRRVGLTTR